MPNFITNLRKNKVPQVLAMFAGCALMYQNCSEMSAEFALGGSSNSSSSTLNFSQTTNQTTQGPLMPDRYVLLSILTSAFGPQTFNTVSSGTFPAPVFTDVQDNGSNCALYEDFNMLSNGKVVQADPMQSNCNFKGTTRLTGLVNPNQSVTREAVMAHACSNLVEAGTPTLAFAMAQVSTGTGVPDNSDQNLMAAWSLFYYNSPAPDSNLMSAMQAMIPVTNPQLADWQSLLYTICVSPQWQML